MSIATDMIALQERAASDRWLARHYREMAEDYTNKARELDESADRLLRAASAMRAA